MSMKVMDGARALDGTNLTADIVQTTLTVGGTATVNSTGVEMTDFFEFLAHILVTSVDAGATLVVVAQESNEAAANFTNITSATQTFAATAANDSAWFDVDWKHPDRGKYARLSATVTGANTAVLSGATFRIQPHGGPVTADASVVEA